MIVKSRFFYLYNITLKYSYTKYIYKKCFVLVKYDKIIRVRSNFIIVCMKKKKKYIIYIVVYGIIDKYNIFYIGYNNINDNLFISRINMYIFDNITLLEGELWIKYNNNWFVKYTKIIVINFRLYRLSFTRYPILFNIHYFLILLATTTIEWWYVLHDISYMLEDRYTYGDIIDIFYHLYFSIGKHEVESNWVYYYFILSEYYSDDILNSLYIFLLLKSYDLYQDCLEISFKLFKYTKLNGRLSNKILVRHYWNKDTNDLLISKWKDDILLWDDILLMIYRLSIFCNIIECYYNYFIIDNVKINCVVRYSLNIEANTTDPDDITLLNADNIDYFIKNNKSIKYDYKDLEGIDFNIFTEVFKNNNTIDNVYVNIYSVYIPSYITNYYFDLLFKKTLDGILLNLKYDESYYDNKDRSSISDDYRKISKKSFIDDVEISILYFKDHYWKYKVIRTLFNLNNNV